MHKFTIYQLKLLKNMIYSDLFLTPQMLAGISTASVLRRSFSINRGG